jgi:hypothetical protein
MAICATRTTSIVDLHEYFERRTDVWLFGDCDGYREFARALRNVAANRSEQRLSESSLAKQSMGVYVVAGDIGSSPALRIVERRVKEGVGARMEFVIAGNPEGLGCLADSVESLIASSDPLDDHIHFDDTEQDSFVVPRSVVLTVRAPVLSWQKFACSSSSYWELIANADTMHAAERIGDAVRQSIHTITLIGVAGLWLAMPSFGDDATAPAPGSSAPGSAAPPSGMVELNFPQAVSLEVMVNYVSKRLGMNILYDEQVTKQASEVSGTFVFVCRRDELLFI